MKKNQENVIAIIVLLMLAFIIVELIVVKVDDVEPSQKFNVSSFLLISDVHLNTSNRSTNYKEDTGLDLWEKLLVKLDSIFANENSPEFVIYNGDLPAHYSDCCYIPPSKRGTHDNNISTVLTGLKTLVTKYNKALYYLPGNNDGLAGDYTSFADEMHKTPFSLISESNNPYPALNINRSGDSAPLMISNVHPRMGYYSVMPVSGLRLISLNTIIFSHRYDPVDSTNQWDDASNQLTWLDSQLTDASNNFEKVYIAMHISPGIDAYESNRDLHPVSMWAHSERSNSWLNQFLSIVARNQTTIAGMFYGHTHMDEFRLLYDSTGLNVTEVAISSPGVSPIDSNNSGFKIVTYNTVNKEILDFTTHYTKPTSRNWGRETYSFNDLFGYSNDSTQFENITNTSISTNVSNLKKIYTVMNGAPKFDVQPGITVNYGD